MRWYYKGDICLGDENKVERFFNDSDKCPFCGNKIDWLFGAYDNETGGDEYVGCERCVREEEEEDEYEEEEGSFWEDYEFHRKIYERWEHEYNENH